MGGDFWGYVIVSSCGWDLRGIRGGKGGFLGLVARGRGTSFPRRRESRLFAHLRPFAHHHRFAHHKPFGLRYRSLAPVVPLRVVGLVHCVRPRREFGPAADLLSCIDKKGGKEATPADSALAVRGLPCAARSLRVGQNSLRSLRSLRSNSCPKSVVDARLRAPRKALRSSTAQKGPKSNTVVASQLSLSTPRFASAWAKPSPSRRREARPAGVRLPLRTS
jgi:hypothetical protein